MVEFAFGLPSDLYLAIREVIPIVGPEWLWRIVNGTEFRLFTDEPLVVAFFLILVLVPWGAAPFYARVPAVPVASWGALDTASAPPVIERPDLRSRVAIAVGLAAGLGIALTSLTLHLALHAGYDPVTRDRDEFLLAYGFWLITGTLFWQLVAGVGAAAVARSFGTLHGTLAGLVAGLAGITIAGLTLAVQGCIPAMSVVVGRACGKPPVLEYLQDFGAPVLTVGIIGAAVAAAATTSVRFLVAGRRGPTSAAPPLPPPPPTRWLPPTP